jgi:hypothetical protein
VTAGNRFPVLDFGSRHELVHLAPIGGRVLLLVDAPVRIGDLRGEQGLASVPCQECAL